LRNIIIKKLIQATIKDPDIILLTSDLGYNAFEPFREQFPKQFYNLGVSENNMVGVGSGLALRGKKVFIYSILPFLIFRCFEQIRNIICHNNLNVKLLGAGGGFSYGNQGVSHNTTEDLSILRSLPNLTIFTPGTHIETTLAFDIMMRQNGPGFIRLGKVPNMEFHPREPKYLLGDGIIIKDGYEIVIFCIGNIIEDVMEAANKLDQLGLNTQVVSFITIKPINKDYIIKMSQAFRAIFTVEEHGELGGLGTAISEILVESNTSNTFFRRIGVNNKNLLEIGTQKYLKGINGISQQGIVERITSYLNEK